MTALADPPVNQDDADARDENGRFRAGNRGGPGNPFARQVASLRKALLRSVCAEDVQQVAQKLLALAKEGNVQAAKLLLSYTIGKPEAAPHPDRMDVDEWDGYRQTAEMIEETPKMCKGGTPQYHLDLVRRLRPVFEEQMPHDLADVMTYAGETEPRDPDG